MRRLVIDRLGTPEQTGDGLIRADGRQRVMPLGSTQVFGVAIGTDSELDQCAIAYRGNGVAGEFSGDFASGFDSGAFLPAGNRDAFPHGSPFGDFVKIGVGAAWVGRIEAPALVVAATRGMAQMAEGDPGAFLSLDLAESPEEAIALAARTRRAPLDVPFCGSMDAASGAGNEIWFPTYGRAWWRLALRVDNRAGTPTKTYTLRGWDQSLYMAAIAQGVNPALVVSTGDYTQLSTAATAAGAVSYQLEADSCWDRISLLIATSGSSMNYRGVFHAED